VDGAADKFWDDNELNDDKIEEMLHSFFWGAICFSGISLDPNPAGDDTFLDYP
jgi:hypothetical protein